MACPDADTLSALVAGTLSEGSRADVANHAASCDPCHAVIEELIRVRETVSNDFGLPRSDVELRPGARVGRYIVEERLGAGGMGVVHAAVDSELQRRVAVKLLRPEQDGEIGSAGRERLMREARTLASLSHPNVVTVFDVGTHHGQLFLAMELVDGGSLSAWLRKPHPTAEIIDRLIEAGRGLAAAHAAGIVHRDVKPDNILVGTDGRARVTDFGLARSSKTPAIDEASSELGVPAETLTRTGTLMGTPAYMAPEQRLRQETTPLTDLWSFCATLYEAVAGVRPFVVEEVEARHAAIEAGRLKTPAPGRRVPAWLRQIASRGLRANPGERWPSMDAVVAALVRRRHRRRNIVLASAALLVAAAAIGIPLATQKTVVAKPSTSRLTWIDERSGCYCPFSACNVGVGCASVCTADDYVVGKKVPGVNTPDQDAIVGVSLDGDTLLYLTGKQCSLDRLMLARRRGDTYVPVDLTPQLDPAVLSIFEGCCTLSPDGGSALISNPTKTGFVQVRFDGDSVIVEGPVGDLIGQPVAGKWLRFPLLAPDGLTLYYRLYHIADDDDETDAVDGLFSVTRADRASRFARPRRVKGRANEYEYATGMSSDGLSLFVTENFETSVVVRHNTSEPFGDPGYTMTPARIIGWRAMPVRGCARLITTMTDGGCVHEDITYLEAVDKR